MIYYHIFGGIQYFWSGKHIKQLLDIPKHSDGTWWQPTWAVPPPELFGNRISMLQVISEL
jgi:hypothetical protein